MCSYILSPPPPARDLMCCLLSRFGRFIQLASCSHAHAKHKGLAIGCLLVISSAVSHQGLGGLSNQTGILFLSSCQAQGLSYWVLLYSPPPHWSSCLLSAIEIWEVYWIGWASSSCAHTKHRGLTILPPATTTRWSWACKQHLPHKQTPTSRTNIYLITKHLPHGMTCTSANIHLYKLQDG